MWKRMILVLCTIAMLSTPAFARVNVHIGVDTPPPPARVEVAPEPRPGYVWAPGYWAWDGGRHAWREGRWIGERRGYHWVPDRWTEYRGPRGPRWHYDAGHWEREYRYGR
jgi:hypothetical protein